MLFLEKGAECKFPGSVLARIVAVIKISKFAMFCQAIVICQPNNNRVNSTAYLGECKTQRKTKSKLINVALCSKSYLNTSTIKRALKYVEVFFPGSIEFTFFRGLKLI